MRGDQSIGFHLVPGVLQLVFGHMHDYGIVILLLFFFFGEPVGETFTEPSARFSIFSSFTDTTAARFGKPRRETSSER